MKLLSRVLAGVLLGFGLSISILAIRTLTSPYTTSTDKVEASIALAAFGLAPVGFGGWVAYRAHQQKQQEIHDRLRSIFFRLLQENHGHLTPLRFAMETGLDGEKAKTYLQDRAKEFDAVFNVSEQGTISYYFDLGSRPDLPSSNPETYDVILETLPRNQKNQAVRVLRELTGWRNYRVKELIRQLPNESIVLQQGVNKATAEMTRQRLEAIGATVLVVLK